MSKLSYWITECIQIAEASGNVSAGYLARTELKNLTILYTAYLSTRQTLSNIGLGMLKGEDQIIAMNEVANIDKALRGEE